MVEEDSKKGATCCGPICWGLLGLLALTGLILGLLFGLGVLGRGNSGSSDSGTDSGANNTNTGVVNTTGNTSYAFPPQYGANSVVV